jgi:shikimate dehydrogenase
VSAFLKLLQSIKKVVEAVRVMGIRGLTCTMPHKLEVMKYLDKIDPIAKKIGAVNTVVNDNGVLTGYNTDWLGIVTPLNMIAVSLKDKRAAIVGAGGAARAMIYGLTTNGAKVKIFNRTIEKAQKLAEEFGCDAGGLEELSEVKNYDIILNSTSIGMEGDTNSPIPSEFINNKQIIFDAVYIPYETPLLKDAKKKDAKIIHGIDMLLYQGTAQFELYTNHKAPEDIMRKVLYSYLSSS